MRNFFSTLIAFLSIILIVSCENDESYPKIFRKNRFENGSKQLYAKNIIELDTNRINEFIERITNEFSYLNIKPSLDSNEVEYNNTDLTIEIISSTKAKIKYGNGYIREFTMSKRNGVIYFYQDSTASTTESFSEEWFRFKPEIIRSEPIPFGQMTYYKPTLYAYEVNGEIQFPILSFMSYYNYGCYCYLRQQNSLNENLLTKIKDGINPSDTIVFRESRIVFAEN